MIQPKTRYAIHKMGNTHKGLADPNDVMDITQSGNQEKWFVINLKISV
jgi:hypothetical protein